MDVGLIRGRGGAFEVVLDNDVVFSKKREGRFPEPGEVAARLRPRLASPPG